MAEVTHEEAQAAKCLVNTAGSSRALIALAQRLPPDVIAALREAHETMGYNCNAANEGLWCCVDVLTDDPAVYAPERVAGAEELLRRYREQVARTEAQP